MTICLLPYGPTAHFRLTSVALHKSISNSANSTSHVPELVLSNFSTPLGLSTGRLLQSLFPPLPNFIGRQVVAIHNQRDFIFVRRFRYMFALRETESSIKMAKAGGLDEQLRTRMQEIGPRFCLKLRWLKRGTLDEGRRRGASGVTHNTDEGHTPKVPQASTSRIPMDVDGDEDDSMLDGADAEVQEMTAADRADEEAARQEMLAETGETEASTSGPPAGDSIMAGDAATDSAAAIAAAGSGTVHPTSTKKVSTHKKRKRRTFSPTTGAIRIPTFNAPKEIPKSELPHHRKIKKGASLLDSLAVTVGMGRGGTRKDKKEWEWDPRMQVSRRKFFL